MQYLKAFASMLWKIFPHFILIVSGVFLWWYLNGLASSSSKIVDSLAGGIVSGLITALLLFVFAILWRKNIEPWFENLLYQDVCIEGEWSGILIPYLGLEDLDRAAKRAAWRRFQEKLRTERKADRGEPIPSSSVADQSGEKEVSAELILHNDQDSKPEADEKEKHIKIAIGSVPIIVRVELVRVGHKISGRIIEIGGASKVHTYNIGGSFKNLILSGCYETCNRDHIDRGALSLMLTNNGKVLEGFFSSYSDGQHKIVPMQCVLKKKNQLADESNGI
ncbi:hypothetical protein J3998_06360 [Thiomicrorhabdus sp. 6S2-11]|uniref:Uncharacterized protein n=1 Tax=Thiomicrorhabdus marina TaxID=2818442 RepID=A0ABS3Q4J8_9GAMM|nr:hypothetical protein [Thiomicrorhabdus marina]MBO1927196.1 hypothetical protein [Thiomicrorhabdus marina]